MGINYLIIQEVEINQRETEGERWYLFAPHAIRLGARDLEHFIHFFISCKLLVSFSIMSVFQYYLFNRTNNGK